MYTELHIAEAGAKLQSPFNFKILIAKVISAMEILWKRTLKSIFKVYL